MSKIGRKPLVLPEGVECTISDGALTVKSKNGELKLQISEHVKVDAKDGVITVLPSNNGVEAKRFWGTFRALIGNMVKGVTEGFTKNLEINGVGYRVNIKDAKLVMQLGFSHDVVLDIPEDLKVVCPDTTHVTVSGIDKQRVGLMASLIRKSKKPEPYKGKGFRYVGERILRKEGKKK